MGGFWSWTSAGPFDFGILVIIAVPLSRVSARVQRIVEDVVIVRMGWIVRRDDGVRHVRNLSSRIPRLPPFPAIVDNDPEPDVPKDVTPMAQCAFESLMFNVSAVYTN